MPAYKTAKKTNQYTTEFKASAVKLTFYSGAAVKVQPNPFMLSRWRKNIKKGKL